MMRRLIILLLIVGCGTEPQDCAGVAGGDAVEDNCGICDNDPTNDCVQDCDNVWGGENNYCLQADYRYPLEIGNRWEYEIFYSGNEALAGEESYENEKIIITIIDTIKLLDSIPAFKFKYTIIDPNAYEPPPYVKYFYGNNEGNAFVIYAESGNLPYILHGFPRSRNGINSFSYNMIFNPLFNSTDDIIIYSDCDSSNLYYSPSWERIRYPINSDQEWIWFDENINNVEMCEDIDSTYIIKESYPPWSTIRNFGDTTTYTLDDQVYESFTINTEWQGLDAEISAYEVYSNIGLMYQYLNLGEQIGMDAFGNIVATWESFITVQLIDFQVLTSDELIEPENDCDLHWSMCSYCEEHLSCPQLIDYANEHWDFGRWVHDYYKWKPENAPEDFSGNQELWDSIREVFVNKTDTISGCDESPHCYVDIWDHSHKVEFTWDENIVSSSDEDVFKPIFMELCGNQYLGMETCTDSIAVIQNRLNNNGVYVIKNHHFYKGIQKYDMFTAGWDDTDSIYVFTSSSGYKSAMTPHKLHYQGLYSNP